MTSHFPPHPPLQAVAPARGLPRLLVGLAGLLAVLIVLGGAGAGAAAWHRQRDDLSAARASRDAAVQALAAALTQAQADGLTPAQLAGLSRDRDRLLAEPSLPARWIWFDGGETGHLRDQVAALQAIRSQVAPAVRGATEAARTAVTGLLADYETAVAAAAGAGLDVGVDTAYATATRVALAAATTPRQVDTAAADLRMRIDEVRSATAAKQAADARAAQAAAQAALGDAHDAAGSALARGDALLAQARQFPHLALDADAATLASAHTAFAAATDIAGYTAARHQAAGAGDDLAGLLRDRSGAYDALAQGRDMVTQAIGLKLDPDPVPAQLDGLAPQLDAGRVAADFTGLTARIDAVVAPLSARVYTAQLGVGKVIVISLADQTLTAYQDGVRQLRTLVTTGRPALPTPPGHYTVLRKNHPWQMVSDWPQSSPYWYPPTWVQYTLWFRDDGYAIHDAPWRGTYGPGTQAYGSHGCVNVPMPTMQTLFAWAEVGTRVLVQ